MNGDLSFQNSFFKDKGEEPSVICHGIQARSPERSPCSVRLSPLLYPSNAWCLSPKQPLFIVGSLG